MKLESMTNEEWEELKARAMKTIHLHLTLEIKHNVLNEKYAYERS